MNAAIVILTIIAMASYFYDETGKFSISRGLHHLIFFTNQSNVLCAAAALITALAELVCMRQGSASIPLWITLLKYVSTVAVTVTFATVMLFLGPVQGWESQFKHPGFIVHAITPVLAVVSYCFTERFYPLGFAQSLLGLLPTLFYGCLYLYKVVKIGEENGGWKDFYGFNKGGKWKNSVGGMMVMTFLLCLILRFLHNM